MVTHRAEVIESIITKMKTSLVKIAEEIGKLKKAVEEN